MIYKCKICGGNLDVKDTKKVIECEYSSTKQTLPRLKSDKQANLYDRANHFKGMDYDSKTYCMKLDGSDVTEVIY